MKHVLPILALISLSACANFKHPSVDNVQSMSGETLCYRHAYAKSNEALKAEIESRNLNCREILDARPVMTDSRY